MNDDPIFRRAPSRPAKGYVSKSGDPGDLVEAIARSVTAGCSCLPQWPKASHLLVRDCRKSSFEMTAREIEILRLLGAGKSLSEIAWLVHSGLGGQDR